MITLKQFNDIKNKYGHCSSFAVWAEVGDTPKSNSGDLSVLDPDINKELLSILNVDVVLLALNGSFTFDPEAEPEPFSNFHSYHPNQQDYKIRYAFKDSPYWGAYMTDIIKKYAEVDSTKTMEYLRRNKEYEQENIRLFEQELLDIGATNPTLIAFGNDVHNILTRNLKDKYKILKVPHYAHFINKDTYREIVQQLS